MSMKGENELQKMEPTANIRVDVYSELEDFLEKPLASEEKRVLELNGWS